MPKLILGLGAVLLLVMAGLALWLDHPTSGVSFGVSSSQEIDATAGAIYSARFADSRGNEQALGQWQHRLLVINFWATWCAPCMEEMPMLARMQEKYRDQGLQIIGIAADSRENVAKFSQKTQIAYPLLPDEMRAIEFSKRLGNRLGLLPFTVMVKPGGQVVFSRMGIIAEQEMIELIVKNAPK